MRVSAILRAINLAGLAAAAAIAGASLPASAGRATLNIVLVLDGLRPDAITPAENAEPVAAAPGGCRLHQQPFGVPTVTRCQRDCRSAPAHCRGATASSAIPNMSARSTPIMRSSMTTTKTSAPRRGNRRRHGAGQDAGRNPAGARQAPCGRQLRFHRLGSPDQCAGAAGRRRAHQRLLGAGRARRFPGCRQRCRAAALRCGSGQAGSSGNPRTLPSPGRRPCCAITSCRS